MFWFWMMMMIVITTLKVKVNLQRIQLGTDHLTCRWFFFSFRIFFFQTTPELEYLFCLCTKWNFFFQNLTLGYMIKTLNHIIFFSSTKIRIFFLEKNPFKLNGRSLSDMLIHVFYKSILNELNTFSCLFCPLN
jgi:hypothetical protein